MIYYSYFHSAMTYILEDIKRASISVASTRLLLFSVSLNVSELYNKLLSINAL